MTMMFYITLLFAVLPRASIAGQRHIFISCSHHSRSQQSFDFEEAFCKNTIASVGDESVLLGNTGTTTSPGGTKSLK